MDALALWFFTGLMLGSLGILAAQWLSRLPAAFAWDPNSHDKMATYSLDLLEQSETKSLLGWVLTQDKQDRCKKYIHDQIRRGSIDEDMNSSVAYLVDGANGAYHFYNPKTQKGLDDSDYVTWIAAKLTSSEVPAPSAFVRATSLDETIDQGEFTEDRTIVTRGGIVVHRPGGSWHFDNELRNYTIVDAMRYFLRGYHHLGFYAIGRCIHLLQDMAVPSHVRNDSHSGMGGDAKDPLEQFSAEADQNKGDWTFSDNRVYASAGTSIFSAAQAIWRSERSGHYRQTANLFNSLAHWTYDTFYSYNTIPGNRDSHDPDTNINPYQQALDRNKCHVSVFQFAQFFRKWGEYCRRCIGGIPPECFSALPGMVEAHVNNLTNCRTVSNACKMVESASNDERQRTCEQCVIDIQSISKSIEAVSIQMNVMISELESYRGGTIPMEAQNPVKRDYYAMQGNNLKVVINSFHQEYDRINADDLIHAAKGSNDCAAVLQKWLDSFPDQQQAAALFADEGSVHAPYCLNYAIIHDQWARTEARAVAFGSYLLANWFEWLYNPLRKAGSNPGIGLWLNENAKSGEAPVLRSLQKIDVGTSEPIRANYAATLGLANHLPCHLDMAVEITLKEEDDFLTENGVELVLSWGRLSPDWQQIEESPSFIAEGSAVPRKKVWSEEQVKGSADGNAVTKVVLSGPDGSKQVKIMLEGTEPYNLGLLSGFPLPPAGGVSRSAERDGILKHTLNLTPGELTGRDDINVSLLRMEVSTPVREDQGA